MAKIKVINRKGIIKELEYANYQTKMAMAQAYKSSPYISKKKALKMGLKLFD